MAANENVDVREERAREKERKSKLTWIGIQLADAPYFSS